MKNLFFLAYILVFQTSFLFASGLSTPPDNDLCDDAEFIVSTPVSGTTTCATAGTNTCAYSDHVVYYEYFVQSSEIVDIEVEIVAAGANPASSLSAQMVYNCSQDHIYFDEPCGSSSIVVNHMDPGSELILYVGSEFGGEGDFEVFINEVPCNPPSNDFCAEAETIPTNGSVDGTNACATSDPNFCFSEEHVVYYEYTVAGPGMTEVEVIMNTFADIVMDIYADCSGTLLGTGFCDFEQTITLAAGTTFYVYVGSPAQGDFNLSINETPGSTAVNDDCSNAEVLSFQDDCEPQFFNVSTVGATPESSDFGFGCNFDVNPTSWYAFNSGDFAGEVTINSDLEFVLITNDCPPGPTNLVTNCDFSATTDLLANTDYLIIVTDPNETTGDIDFDFGGIPDNDNCFGAEFLDTCGEWVYSNQCASGDGSMCSSNGNVVYFQYTVSGPGPQDLDLDVFPEDFNDIPALDVEMSVWSSCTGSLYDSSLPCTSDFYSLTCVPEGTELIFAVGTDVGNAGEFIITICNTPTGVSNNSCSNPMIWNLQTDCGASTIVAGDNTGACPSPFDSFGCDQPDDPASWYTFNSGPDPATYEIGFLTDGFTFSVFENDCPAFDQLNDCTDWASITVEANTDYLVLVMGPIDDPFEMEFTYLSSGNVEICDGIDNDCDGEIDEGVLLEFYFDNDGDGFGDPANSIMDCSAPAGYVSDNTDCNDSDFNINPDAFEIFNNDVDENCDGIADIIDLDEDGFNSDEDCDDSNEDVYPGATEICDGLDNNCDGDVDEGLLLTFYPDNDGDGYGADTGAIMDCSAPAGFVSDNTDCDDMNPNINPGSMEIPNNMVDEDCDGMLALIDNDNDGYTNDVDCNDGDASINPGATEIPDNDVDENCDGIIAITDMDMDGYGINDDCDDSNPNINPGATEIPNNDVDEDCDGEATVIDFDMDGSNSSEDCNDTNPNVYPGADEICDGLDNDCDGNIDEDVLLTFYQDVDLDGYGNPDVVVTGCNPPAGYVSNNTDCNDMDGNINPAATEIPNNDIDENCDGQFEVIDADMDGYSNSEDCNDADANINPGATEIPDNDVDEDCDGIFGITDEDGDGYGINEDCNDADANINPGATEIPDNEVDEDCDGELAITDEDGDGYGINEDCDDTNPDINPGAEEIPGNDVDEDCNGIIDQFIDEDEDGYIAEEDCDDTNPDINPGATEIPNNDVDEDCDGEILIIDEDGDGWNSDEDCDDMNPEINPDAEEILDNEVDEDCDGIANITDQVAELGDLLIELYPNPVSDFIFLESDSNLDVIIEIYGSNGELIQKLDQAGKKIMIQTNEFSQGLYLMIVSDKKSSDKASFRVIKM